MFKGQGEGGLDPGAVLKGGLVHMDDPGEERRTAPPAQTPAQLAKRVVKSLSHLKTSIL